MGQFYLHKLGIGHSVDTISWKNIPRDILPICSIKGVVTNKEEQIICKYTPIGALGKGTFGHIDKFKRTDASGNVNYIALKRPNNPAIDLLTEAFFQHKLHNDLRKHGISFCVPKVYDIFIYKQTNDVWFSMEAYEPTLLSTWCIKNIGNKFAWEKKKMILLILQIAILLEVFETKLKVDHRDLKVNNILVVDKPIKIKISINGVTRDIEFPFHVVFIDFGFACCNATVDVREDIFPPIDPCPKKGRDIYQILVSLWKIKSLQTVLVSWGWSKWFHDKLETIFPSFPTLLYIEGKDDLDWMYTITDNKEFTAPLCVPSVIIEECLDLLSL